jgi:hypothetical protein
MKKILYHGSNIVIGQIDLSKGLRDKDFGKGFYLTEIEEQAEEMAKRRTRIAGFGSPSVTAFAFDDVLLESQELRCKVFPDTPCEEWAEFVNANRHSSETGFSHTYDIVVGPIANDGVAYQLERYNEGAIDLSTLVRELSWKHLSRQYFFGTELAIAKLVKL